MISPCSPPLEPPIPSPKTPASQAPIIPPPPLPPNGPEVAFAPSPSSLQAPIPPPPPLPPPPATTGFAPPHVFGLEKSQLLKEALERAGPVPRSREDVKRLLRLHKDRFRSDLQWILFCADLPSLIQEGPQCGLVALWMAGTLLAPPSGTPLERLVQVAMERGYTAQGEMFSVADMGRLAQEALGCQAEVLYGGLGGPNRDRVLQHLVAGQPLLIPYDEDFNHEPCQRKGYKAHWAVSAGGSSLPGPVPSPWTSQPPASPHILTLTQAPPHHPRQEPGLGHPCPCRVLSRDLASSGYFSVCQSGLSANRNSDHRQGSNSLDCRRGPPTSRLCDWASVSLSGNQGDSSTHVTGKGRKTL
ncbi:actin maturation protease isoform X1 [Hippopotamus amphibius kiboko]|uniref:actin maturation protease isoform X1 n=1 Tax=Hippopotamus amphibius kiboko TaxID=575201 RepID=UPI002591E9B7|nr:actin maturation protease isoform X1 [Hippopotamus amphibius kiboko]